MMCFLLTILLTLSSYAGLSLHKFSEDYVITVSLLNGSGKSELIIASMGYVNELQVTSSNINVIGYYLTIKNKNGMASMSRVVNCLDKKLDVSIMFGEEFKSVSMAEIVNILKADKAKHKTESIYIRYKDEVNYEFELKAEELLILEIGEYGTLKFESSKALRRFKVHMQGGELRVTNLQDQDFSSFGLLNKKCHILPNYLWIEKEDLESNKVLIIGWLIDQKNRLSIVQLKSAK